MRIIRPSEKLIKRATRRSDPGTNVLNRRRMLELSALTLAVSACADSSGDATGSGSAGNGGTGGGSDGCTALASVPPAEGAIILPGEGEIADDEDGRYKVRAADLGNYWSIMEMTLAVDQLLTPHTHEEYDQAVYLIEGELGFEFGGAGGEVVTGGAGSYVIKPRGLSHSFWNIGDVPVRYIEMSANVTFERFVDALQETDDIAEINRLAQEHSVEFHYDQVPRLLVEHGLTSVKGSGVTLPQLDEFNPPGGPPRP